MGPLKEIEMTTKKTPAKKKAAKKRATKKKAARKPKATAPKAGTVIERTFKGETYKLRVTETGFAIGKETFRTLTSAARHVTGYKAVSGPRFWLGAGTEKGGKA